MVEGGVLRPKFFGFLLILVIGYFVAKALAKLADGVRERVGFDPAVERGGVKRALERTKYDASDILTLWLHRSPSHPATGGA